MSGDTLSDLLRAVRLRGAIFFYVEGNDPWVAETPHSREIIPAIMPGVEHLMEFHGVARGSCWAGIAGEPPIRLDAGDLVIFPHGEHHVMPSAPGLRVGAYDPGSFCSPMPRQLPFAIGIHGQEQPTALLDGGGSHQTTLVCGFVGCDAKPFNPLLASMPRVLRVPGIASDSSSWIGSFLRSVV